MSAAKMVADSTQSDIPEKSTRKRKKIIEKRKEKKKKLAGKKGKKKQQAEDEYDENDLDLDVEIQPISHFVKDRSGLVEEMFHCVRGTSLQRALPDVLKELPLEELKKRCLEQLEVMSKKRIRRILAGDDPANISSSEEDEESTEEEMEEQAEEEEEYEEVEDEEMQMADSTSQPAALEMETEDSDRDEEEQEESGSPSPAPSDDGEEQQPKNLLKGSNVKSDDPDTRSLAQQNLELRRKLEEEHKSYKLRLQAYKAGQTKKLQPDEAEEEIEDTNGQLLQTAEDAEEGEVIDVKQEEVTEGSYDAIADNSSTINDKMDLSKNAEEIEAVSATQDKLEREEPTILDNKSDISDLKDIPVTIDGKEDESDTGDIKNDKAAIERSETAQDNTDTDSNNIKEDNSGSDNNQTTEVTIATESSEINDNNSSADNKEKESVQQLDTENQGKDESDLTDTSTAEKEVKVNEMEENSNINKKTEVDDENKDINFAGIDVEKTEIPESTEKSDCEEVAEVAVKSDIEEVAEKSDNEDVNEEMNEEEDEEMNSESEGEIEEEPQDVSKSLTQNQMELLELEMRARAIKAMLKMAK